MYLLNYLIVLPNSKKPQSIQSSQQNFSCNNNGGKRAEEEKKKAKKPNLWPDLPQQLIHLVATNSLVEEIYSKGVTKSWRTEPIKCRSNPTPPWLEISANYTTDDKQPHTFNIPFRVGCFWYCCKERPTLVDHHFLGCSRRLVLAKGASSSGLTLWKSCPIQKGWWQFPPWDAKVPLSSAAVSSFPWIDNRRKNTKCTVMVLTGITNPAFVFYRIWEGKEWIKSDSTIVDPHCSDPNQRAHLLRFTNGIWLKGKFYALSMQGTVAVIADIDTDFRITAVGKQRAVPSVSSKHYRECMIESEGKILLILLISRNSVKEVDYVEVYQLNTTNLAWIKKENLGDKTLFLGSNCCMLVSASKLGCKRNCIYFRLCSVNVWRVYEMETGTFHSTKFLDWVDSIAEE